jgi:hypothetical protein
MTSEEICRSAGCVLSSELIVGACDLLVIQAFMEYNKSAWSEFEDDMLSGNVMKFYDTHNAEFFSLSSWENLQKALGI